MPPRHGYFVAMVLGVKTDCFAFFTPAMANQYAEKLKGTIQKEGIPSDGSAKIEILFYGEDGRYRKFKSVLECCRFCKRRLPNLAERKAIYGVRERDGQQWIEVEDSRKRFEFCVCPAEEPGRDRGPEWSRNVVKAKAALALKYVSNRSGPFRGTNRKDVQEAKFLLQLIVDRIDGKVLHDRDRKKLKRFIEFADPYMYDLAAPGNNDENITLSDLIDSLSPSSPLRNRKRRISKNQLSRLAVLTNQFIGAWPVWFKPIIPESVYQRMYDEDFNGDPWDGSALSSNYGDDAFLAAEVESSALEMEIEAIAEAEPGMSGSEIREKLYWKLPEYRGIIGLEWYKTCDASAMILLPGDRNYRDGIDQNRFRNIRLYIESLGWLDSSPSTAQNAG